MLQTKTRPAQTKKDSSLLLVHTGRCSCQLWKLLSLTQAFKLYSDYSKPFICLGCWRIFSRKLPWRDVLEAIDLPEVALFDEITPRSDLRANRPDVVDNVQTSLTEDLFDVELGDFVLSGYPVRR